MKMVHRIPKLTASSTNVGDDSLETYVDNLVTNNVTVQGKLTATMAEIEDLIADQISAIDISSI